jgi:hypothetical protein
MKAKHKIIRKEKKRKENRAEINDDGSITLTRKESFTLYNIERKRNWWIGVALMSLIPTLIFKNFYLFILVGFSLGMCFSYILTKAELIVKYKNKRLNKLTNGIMKDMKKEMNGRGFEKEIDKIIKRTLNE